MDPVIEEPSSKATDVDWRAMQQRAAARCDESVRSVLLEVGRGAWVASRGRSWDIVATPEEAAWRLIHLLATEGDGGSSLEQLGVRATIDQSGELVAFQVDNGE